MALKVIGASFGRTGTESLKRALEMLGYAPCHHMYEVMPYPEQVAKWQAISDGATPDWDNVYEGFEAAVDWPTARFWRELAEHYPEAKIVISVRSAESWYRSFSDTILQFFHQRRADGETHLFAYNMIANETFGNKIDDAEHCMAVYDAHLAEVRATIAPERLIEIELGAGWEPLCAGLGIPVPGEPYPSGNAKGAFHERTTAALAERAAREAGEL